MPQNPRVLEFLHFSYKLHNYENIWIEEALNFYIFFSLDIRHQPNQNKSPVDVMFPSFQRSDPLPQKVSLTSSYPDAFAKIAPPIEPVSDIFGRKYLKFLCGNITNQNLTELRKRLICFFKVIIYK